MFVYFLSVTDSTLLSSLDLPHPSKVNLFDESLSLSNYFASLSSTMNNPPTTASVDEWDQKTFGLNVDDFALLCSSLMTTTSSHSEDTTTTSIDQFHHGHEDTAPHNNQAMPNNSDDSVFNGINGLGFISPKPLINGEETIEPPPGFESFHLNSSLSNDLLLSQTTNNSLINTTTSNRIAETPVSSSDKLNFSQLFASINAGKQSIVSILESRKIVLLIVNEILSYFRGNTRTTTSIKICQNRTCSFIFIVSFIIYIR